MEILNKLQNWYFSNCDGEWEHDFGIKIGTLDNPGWSVKINLNGTKNKDIQFEKVEIERSEEDWIHCSVKDNVFLGYGGSKNLEEILKVFIEAVS